MRMSRYNYKLHVNEEDEEVPTEAGNNQLTQKMRTMRTSASRGRSEISKTENKNKTWKPVLAPRKINKGSEDQSM